MDVVNRAAQFNVEPKAIETLDRPLAIVVQRTPNKIDVQMAGGVPTFSLIYLDDFLFEGIV